MRYLFTYLLLAYGFVAFSQESPNPCGLLVNGEDVDNCAEIKCLYENQNYVEAYSKILALENDNCTDGSQQMTIALTFASNSYYEKALSILVTLQDNPNFTEEAQFQINRISKLKILAEKKTGTYIQNLINANTKYNDLVAFELYDTLFCLYDKTDTISYFPRIEKMEGSFHFPNESNAQLYFGESFFTWENYDNLGAGHALEDSLIYLTALPHKAFGGNSDFEIICLEAKTKKVNRNLGLVRKGSKVMHPALKDSFLYFSSDIKGGYGGMDLYRVSFDGEKYGEWENLGPAINSANNEVFPAIAGDTIFFASDRADLGFGGLDLYKSSISSPYSINLGTPVNTAYDDFRPTAINDKIKYFVSNRDGGKGGDDIYKVSFVEAKTFFQNLAGKINAKGADLSSVIIKITSDDGTFSKTTSLGKDGSFSLAHIKGLENYEISIVDGVIPEGSSLALFGEEGNVIKEVEMNESGQFKFELLSPLDYFLERVQNKDQSVLSVDILGMIDTEESPDNGFKIYLEDSNGELIGMAVTDSDGNFVFKSVNPDEKYIIRSEVKDPKALINILDNDGEVISTIKPTESDEFVYVRLTDANNVITLTNESNQKVKISDNELFNLPVLHFGLDDAVLTSESKESLNYLIVLLEKNPSVSLELSGFTDSRGSAEYNLHLSQERINAVIDYLIKWDINGDRLVGTGFGETKLLNHCADGVECSESEHAINRRTEIRIYQPSEP